jgi:hypothetical protein
MMISLTIDTSVLALPQENTDLRIEEENIRLFVANIMALQELEKSSQITVSYIDKTNDYLFNSKLFYISDINSRIRNVMGSSNAYKNDEPLPNLIGDYYMDLASRIKRRRDPKTYKEYKGRIGIYKNFDDFGPPQKNDFYSYIYPYRYGLLMRNVFTQYHEFIARLNEEYKSEKGNYLVLSGNKPVTEVSIKDKPVTVKVIGIQEAVNLIQKKTNFNDLVAACEKAKKEFDERLVFGARVDKDGIKTVASRAGPPELVYLYLRTLYSVAKIIIVHSLSINKDEQELVKMLNAHGLICSPDREDYHKYRCKERTFDDGTGEYKFFNIHLKPSTHDDIDQSDKNSLTVRIYLKWDSSGKVMRVGWIGGHPNNCYSGKCPNRDCAGYRARPSWEILR